MSIIEVLARCDAGLNSSHLLMQVANSETPRLLEL